MPGVRSAASGHVDVARRAAHLFDRVVFAISTGTGAKDFLFTGPERIELACAALAALPNVVVDSYGGLTVDYARRIGAVAIVKGVRTVADFRV